MNKIDFGLLALCLDNIGVFEYRVRTQFYTTIFLLDLLWYFLEIINNNYYNNLIDREIIKLAKEDMEIIKEYKALKISKITEIGYLEKEIANKLKNGIYKI